MFSFRPGTCDQNVYLAAVECNEYHLPETFSPDDVIIDNKHLVSIRDGSLRR